jgi:putative nucleotidyltransferase with HDIG domain
LIKFNLHTLHFNQQMPVIATFAKSISEIMILPREQALELLHEHIKNERMIAHCLASEAVMRALARKLEQNEEAWGLAGLLHDIDVEDTNADPYIHGLQGADMLLQMGVDEGIVDAIRMHNEVAAGKERTTLFQHALAAGETITGLITATTYVYPDRKVASVKPSSVVKRMKEKAFAASVKRENIMECEMIGIPIADFAALSVAAMSEIADEIGL